MISATVKRTIKKSPELLEKVNSMAMPEIANIMEATAKRLAPSPGKYGDGTLRNSIQQKTGSDFAMVYTNMEYAIYNEFGTGIYAEGGGGRKDPWVYYNEKAGHFVRTHGMEARPFMRPAIDDNKKAIINKWKEVFRRVYGR